MGWCEQREETRDDEYWSFLHIIIDKRIDQLSLAQGDEFKKDCNAIISYLENVQSVYLNYNTSPNITINFSAAKYLPSLERISAYEYPSQNVKFETLDNIHLKELRLVNTGLTTIQFGRNLSLDKLVLDKNPLATLGNIHEIKNLKTLSLSGSTLKDLSELENIPLKSLALVGMNTSILYGLDKVSSEIEELDLRDTFIMDTSPISKFVKLKDLKLTGISGRVDLSSNTNIERLYLNEFANSDVTLPNALPKLKSLTFSNSDLDDIKFLAGSYFLEELSLTYNRIQDLKVFKENPFPFLRSINLSVNPILNVRDLTYLQYLEILNLYRTPLATNQVPKTEENCPTNIGPQPLQRFCSN